MISGSLARINGFLFSDLLFRVAYVVLCNFEVKKAKEESRKDDLFAGVDHSSNVKVPRLQVLYNKDYCDRHLVNNDNKCLIQCYWNIGKIDEAKFELLKYNWFKQIWIAPKQRNKIYSCINLFASCSRVNFRLLLTAMHHIHISSYTPSSSYDTSWKKTCFKLIRSIIGLVSKSIDGIRSKRPKGTNYFSSIMRH